MDTSGASANRFSSTKFFSELQNKKVSFAAIIIIILIDFIICLHRMRPLLRQPSTSHVKQMHSYAYKRYSSVFSCVNDNTTNNGYDTSILGYILWWRRGTSLWICSLVFGIALPVVAFHVLLRRGVWRSDYMVLWCDRSSRCDNGYSGFMSFGLLVLLGRLWSDRFLGNRCRWSGLMQLY